MVRFCLPLVLSCTLVVAIGGLAACGSTALVATPTFTPEDGTDAGDTTDGDPSGGSDGSTTLPDGAKGPPPPPPDSISVIVEPSDKAGALLAAIQGAKTSVHMTMYLMNDKRFISALIAQHNAKVDVKVLLNQTFGSNSGSNQAVYDQLTAAGVAVKWAPSAYTLTHEKCVIIDGTEAWIMTMNLETTSSSNREFLAIDTMSADITEAEQVFTADFAGAAVTPGGALLVAPVNARPKLLTLIQSATSTVDVEGEELSDTMIVGALVAAKSAGHTVRVVLADNAPTSSQSTAVSQLKAANIPVVSVHTPYIHSKAIVVDGTAAYIGSENFTTGSLQYNRELGVVTTNVAGTASIAAAIAKDFAAGSAL